MLNICTPCISWEIGSYEHTHFCHNFVAILWRKAQHDFPKMRGGGSKAVWNFSENSSVLETASFPYIQSGSPVQGKFSILLCSTKILTSPGPLAHPSVTIQAKTNLILCVNISSVVEEKFHNTHLRWKFHKNGKCHPENLRGVLNCSSYNSTKQENKQPTLL